MEFLFLPIRITGLTPELLSRFSGTITVSPAGMGRGCKIPVNGVCGTGVDKRDSVLERGRTVGIGTTKPGWGMGDPGYHPRCRFFGGPEMNMVAWSPEAKLGLGDNE